MFEKQTMHLIRAAMAQIDNDHRLRVPYLQLKCALGMIELDEMDMDDGVDFWEGDEPKRYPEGDE